MILEVSLYYNIETELTEVDIIREPEQTSKVIEMAALLETVKAMKENNGLQFAEEYKVRFIQLYKPGNVLADYYIGFYELL